MNKLMLFQIIPIEQIWQMLVTYGVVFVKNTVVATVVFLTGRYIIKWLIALFTKMLRRSKVDLTLYSFLESIINVVLWFTLVVIVISIMGIETSSFIALFASAGMAIGMALSGTLQNFAGGVMILLFRPFKVGDYIDAQGYAGTVKEIQIFNTIITTTDNQTIIVPNGGLSTSSMKNYSSEPYRRVDLEFQFAYGTDLDKVKEAISEIQRRNPLIMQGPVDDSKSVAAPFIGLLRLDSSGVTLSTKVWCKNSDYWTVYYYMNETVYQELKARGFMFPFSRMDVKILNNPS